VMSVVMAIPGAAVAALVLSTLYFAYLAFKIATAPPLSGAAGQAKPPSFFAGVMLSLVNPKGYAAMAALFAGFALLDDARLDAAAKIGVLTAVIAAVNIAWLLAGSALTRFFRNPRTNRIINIVFAVLLILSLVPVLM
jgi:threonine/homoserine/homoserine lactone efflux protein